MKGSVRRCTVVFGILAYVGVFLTPINAVKIPGNVEYDTIKCKRILVDDNSGNMILLGSVGDAMKHIPLLKGNPGNADFGMYVIDSNDSSVGFYLPNEVYLITAIKASMGVAALGVNSETGGSLALTNGEGDSMSGIIASDGKYSFMARSKKGGAAILGIHSETEGGHILLTTSDGKEQMFSRGGSSE